MLKYRSWNSEQKSKSMTHTGSASEWWAPEPLEALLFLPGAAWSQSLSWMDLTSGTEVATGVKITRVPVWKLPVWKVPARRPVNLNLYPRTKVWVKKNKSKFSAPFHIMKSVWSPIWNIFYTLSAEFGCTMHMFVKYCRRVSSRIVM